jgi:hypothetical protein
LISIAKPLTLKYCYVVLLAAVVGLSKCLQKSQLLAFTIFLKHLQRHHVHMLREEDRNDLNDQHNDSKKRSRAITDFLSDSVSPSQVHQRESNKLARQLQAQAKLEIKLIRTNIINAFVKVIVHGCYPFSIK